MSQESCLSALSQEAVSRLTPYELVERSISLCARSYNALDVEPVELEGGSTLYTINSGLYAKLPLYVKAAVEGNELVRRQHLAEPFTVVADVVELRPPSGDDQGDARLYSIKEPLTPSLAEARAPFHAIAVDAVTKTDPTWGKSPIRFDGVSNVFYTACPDMGGPDQTYLSSGYEEGRVVLLAEEQTNVHLQEVGINQLDKEIGVLATLSGVARVALDKRQFARITPTGVSYGPATEQTVSINLPEGTPQHNGREFHRIPQGATVGPNDQGELVPHGERANTDRYKHAKLNPSLDPAKAFELMPDTAIDWTDGTAAFIDSMQLKFARLLPMDAQASYEQTLRLAQDRIREALAVRREPYIGNVGCLAVAGHIAKLSDDHRGVYRVDEAYFSQAI